MAEPWEFWIDVGGTFTDCLGRRPDGTIVTHKLLSTGVYKGMVGEGSTADCIVDPARAADPPGFFEGFRITLLEGESASRRASESARDESPRAATRGLFNRDVSVRQFDPQTGRIVLEHPLTIPPRPGMVYELSCGEEAPITGIRWLMGKRRSDLIGPIVVKLGTTRGTNALLERQGARTAFVTTKGFRDVLRIAYQNRPKLFSLHIRKPKELYEEVVEIDERIDKDGNVLQPLDPEEVRAKLAALREKGITALAVCLMNSYRNGTHERIVERIGRELGFEQISCQVTQLQKIVSRGDTTVVDAYLTPIIREYVSSIRKKVPHGRVAGAKRSVPRTQPGQGLAALAPATLSPTGAGPIKLMTSAGGLVDAEHFVGKDSILSGPAGGVVGQAYVAREAGFEKSIGFDMGGTSTDVSRFDGRYERRFEMEVNDPESDIGVRIVAPMLAIETVAAGGGSMCWFDGQKPRVGPRSAGADPGPACYGRGGPLCVTDVNLYLGKILPECFPFPLDRSAAESRLGELIDQIAAATGQRYRPEELAAGFTAIANANMAAPIKKISIARGYDVREYVLVSFGGAGAQHACAIARELGIKKILQHPYAGILSAFGIGMADVKKFAARDVSRQYNPEAIVEIEPVFRELESKLIEQVQAEGIPEERIRPPERFLEMRYVGQEHRILVPRPADGDYLPEFERLHRQLYGFQHERGVEIYAARVEVTGEMAKPPWPRHPIVARRRPQPAKRTRAYFDGQWLETGVFLREDLRPGDGISGPAIIVESTSTVVVDPGWECEVSERDDLVLSDVAGAASKVEVGTEVDAVTLELLGNRFASIAEQMGATLEKTALSTNVKERLDFSCAIFDPEGDLVVNAPHIPVHLGAMSECVKRLMEDVPDMRPGDVFVTNDPYRGGSHLPDVTVVTPVFESRGTRVEGQEPQGPGLSTLDSRLLFFTASRAHHAEIGGITPGSMPPFSKNLEEEGVVIRHFRLVRDERASEERLRERLSRGPYPSRSVHENMADINAQVAANQTGAAQLLAMVDRYGLEVVHAYMGHIQRAAENKMRSALLKIPPGEHRFTDHMDDGTPISVTITVRHVGSASRGPTGEPEASASGLRYPAAYAAGSPVPGSPNQPIGEAIVDLTGSGPVHPGNLNANRAIVTSAVLYCFRCLIDEDIPLNAGVLTPIEIRLPENCFLNPPTDADPAKCPAVVGGNVETSQRIVDCIFGALGVIAASQGTMNNFIFGRTGEKAFGYYETIGGGSGAGPSFDGADAVHVHMTNTRLTDPEVLEHRYPVRVLQFEIRRGSGGAGRHRGGDGIVRQIEFLEPLTVSILSQRRTRPPFGLEGGRPGATGRNLIRRAGSNTDEELGPAVQFEVGPGDVVTIMTPGGGGYGTPAHLTNG